MSESEDSNILDDIHALEEALKIDIKEEEQKQQHDDPDLPQDSSDENDYLEANCDIDANRESLNAFEINNRLITGLTIVKSKLSALIMDCEQKIRQLDEKINSTDIPSFRSKYPISIIGMPYFKDKNNFFAPRNEDAILKESRGELSLLSLKKPMRWSKSDRDLLLRAVHNQAIELVLSTNLNDGSDDEEPSKRKRRGQTGKSRLILPRSLNELVGPLGEKKFDWHKISIIDFDNKHSPEECQAMWNVYLHPQIKKSEWTSTEDRRLLRYARQHGFQDWDAITLQLGTNRSAYQCFIRYNTIKKVPTVGRAWSKAEDKHLMKIIDHFKIGDYIPWSQIASYLNRTKQQIYARWVYSKAPHLRKGRFTFTESDILLKAIKTYGRDFSKIASDVMPNRTSVQLSEHYCMLMRNKTIGENIWTVDDDMRLIRLHEKYGNAWSKIATHIFHKTRTQVRQRFNALIRYTKKGISIESIPRHPATSDNNKLEHPDEEDEEEIPVIDSTDIKLRLYETLCFPPMMPTTRTIELYKSRELACETKKLYRVLTLLRVNLDNILYDCVDYIHMNRREKQLLISLKEYIDRQNNGIQNDEVVESLRLEMFGNDEDGEGSSFVPPIPFCGYARGKIKETRQQSQCNIDCNTDLNRNFLVVDINAEVFDFPELAPFVNEEESSQLDKFGQSLIQCSNHTNQNERNLSVNKRNKRYCTLMEQSNNLQETAEQFDTDVQKNIPRDAVLPNQATLLGLKNLFLWKFLYECQLRESSESSNLIAGKKTDRVLSVEYKEAYELLRTRLYQLFKFPISLSHTRLQIHGSEATFPSNDEDEDMSKKVSKKRKQRTRPEDQTVQPSKRAKLNILADKNVQRNTNVKVTSASRVRNCKAISKKYKIVEEEKKKK